MAPKIPEASTQGSQVLKLSSTGLSSHGHVKARLVATWELQVEVALSPNTRNISTLVRMRCIEKEYVDKKRNGKLVKLLSYYGAQCWELL